jgi:hypothetical protein
MANEAYLNLASLLSGAEASPFAPFAVTSKPRLNVLQLIFDPAAWRPYIANWEIVARATLERLHREAIQHNDPALRQLLHTLLAYPEVPARWRHPDFDTPQDVIIPVEIRFGEHLLKLFTTVTTLGTPQDITLQELSIESFHAADAQTEQLIRALATAK